jgi:large subunit ribosomal protein L25
LAFLALTLRSIEEKHLSLRALLKSIIMNYIDIAGEPRQVDGKKGAKAVRNAKRIPACIYGNGNFEFSTTAMDVRDLIYTPEFKVVRITVGDKTHHCIVKEVQFHPVTEAIVHIDFQELLPNRPMKLELPVVLTGSSVGVRAGGKMLQVMRRVLIKTTPENLVEHLTADVTNLDLGQAMRVRELQVPEGIEILVAPSIPICQVEIPRALRSAAAAASKAGK